MLITCCYGGYDSLHLAGMVAGRVLSLALFNITGVGFECFPNVVLETID